MTTVRPSTPIAPLSVFVSTTSRKSGIASVTTTSSAVALPLFVTTSVNSTISPMWAWLTSIDLVIAGSATCGLGSLVACGRGVLLGVAVGIAVDVAVGAGDVALGAVVADGFVVAVRVGGSVLGVSAARGMAEAGD